MKTGMLLCCFFVCMDLTATTYFTKVLFGKEEDLKRYSMFGNFPRHGLMLLHWFANNIEINQNQVVLQFSAAQGHYGFHEYDSNKFEAEAEFPELLDNKNRMYFIVGDLLHAAQLPDYVTQDYYNSPVDPTRNIDRLIIRVHRTNPEIVDKVYILVEENGGIAFKDRVSLSLLRQIQALSMDDSCDSNDPRISLPLCKNLISQQQVEDLQSVYPPIPGLAWFLVLAGYNGIQRVRQFSQSLSCSTQNTKSKCEAHNKIKLEVQSISNGYTRISWSGIPENILRIDSSVGLYKDKQSLKIYPLDGTTYGSIDTNWALNPGLQVKLTFHDRVIWTGPEFNDANRIPPTNIRGYDARLQLYTKDGYASARLFIKKSFSNWQSVFENSWVGFYTSALDENKANKKYQWVTKFKKNSDQDYLEEYDVFEYQSGMAIGPGVQLRFLINKGYTTERARTEPWKGPDDED